MKVDSKTYDLFTAYFLESQNLYDGSWCHKYDKNIVAKTIYTCQVLVTLSHFPKNKYIIESVKKAINFLLTTKTDNNLYNIYIKINSLSFWEEFIPKSELYRKLHKEVKNYFEYGGRINSSSFELCFIIECLLNTQQYKKVEPNIKKRINTLLKSFINQPIENIIDISHYSWALLLYSLLNNEINEKLAKQLYLSIKKYSIKDGYLQMKAPLGRPSKTPALRSNEFLTAHIVLTCSRILQNNNNSNLYHLTQRFVETIIDDSYFVALYYRALYEYSKISIKTYHEGLNRIENLIKNTTPIILKNMEQKMLFISHSEKDIEVASKLIDFIESSLNTEEIDIRCTSVPGYQLPFGKTISQQLKEDIHKSLILIVLINKNSLKSNWVLFELGAAWALGLTIIPILGDNLTYKSLPGPLSSQSCIEISSDGASNRLRDAIKQISHEFNIIEKTGGKSQSKLDLFIKGF